MFPLIDSAELIEHSGCGLAFEHSDDAAQDNGRRVAQQKVDMIAVWAKFDDSAMEIGSNLSHISIHTILPLGGECMLPKLSTKDYVGRQVVDAVTCTVKLKIPDTLAHRLEAMVPAAEICIQRMLADRSLSSSKYYPELPCVISKSLIAKYQSDKKLRAVTHLVLPICGDKGRQIQWDGSHLRIPAVFQKDTLSFTPERTPLGDAQGRVNLSGEFFHREGVWYLAISYRTAAAVPVEPRGAIGVDRNSVGAVATLADPANGKVLHLGFDPARTKACWRGRKRNLQKQGKKRLLTRLRRKQSRITKHQNHIVSKAIVDYAQTHRRAIVLEDLGEVRSKGSKIRSYSERAQWSFFQLRQYILYKAALLGVVVYEVEAAYSSQECSRCHQLSKPAGKKFSCAHCGHNDHRDANAAFTLAQRMPIGGVTAGLSEPASGLIGDPLSGKHNQDIGTASLRSSL